MKWHILEDRRHVIIDYKEGVIREPTQCEYYYDNNHHFNDLYKGRRFCNTVIIVRVAVNHIYYCSKFQLKGEKSD